LDQTLVCNDEKLAGAIAKAGELIELEGKGANSQFIREKGSETDLYLILAGHVSVRIKGREIAPVWPARTSATWR
jgi:hypothetical protein